MTTEAAEVTVLGAALDTVAQTHDRLVARRQAVDDAQRELQAALREAFAAGADVVVLADMLGVTPSRVYQLRRSGR
jgi:mannose/fructose-specific phosphotransferase system component IIA